MIEASSALQKSNPESQNQLHPAVKGDPILDLLGLRLDISNLSFRISCLTGSSPKTIAAIA